MQAFLAQFKFEPRYSLYLGVEREAFLVKEGLITPIAAQVLEYLPDRVRYGYELSACQLEDRVGPTTLDGLKELLLENNREIEAVERELGFKRLFCEVGPTDMPLDVYPDPAGRYAQIVKGLPRETLLAACRVIGTHVHVGMPDHETALRVYNGVVKYWEELCRMGDGSGGQRLAIYRQMAPDFQPLPYRSWEDFYHEAVAKNFEFDPRKCWHLIRLSVHGTIEFRMFGATTELDRIVTWAARCQKLCKAFLTQAPPPISWPFSFWG